MKKERRFLRMIGITAVFMLLGLLAAGSSFAAEKPNGSSEFDLSGGDLVITEKTISQGSSSVEHKNVITVTGTGNEIETKGYKGTLVLKNAKVKKSVRLTKNTDLTLVLEGENRITDSDDTALQVTAGNKVTIQGSGSLSAEAGNSGAGIGGTADSACGTIVIKSGKITALGSGGGAGIGSSSGMDAGKGDIRLTGGTIKARGGTSSRSEEQGGAAIGAGFLAKGTYSGMTDLKISITGGTIDAVGGWGAAAIGSGAGKDHAKNINIGEKADLTAAADGTKFAIDTYHRSAGKNIIVAAANVLQGTFMNQSQYEGLAVSIYKDYIPDSGVDLFYHEKVAQIGLPQGYRSFAVTVEKNQDYLIQGGEEWFSMDLKEAAEDNSVESAAHTAHFATGASSLSDNCWLYIREVYAEMIVPDHTIPAEEEEGEAAPVITTSTTTTTTTTTKEEPGSSRTAGDGAASPSKRSASAAGTAVNAAGAQSDGEPEQIQKENGVTATLKDQPAPLAAGIPDSRTPLNLALVIIAVLLSGVVLLFYRIRRKRNSKS